LIGGSVADQCDIFAQSISEAADPVRKAKPISRIMARYK